MKKIGLFILCIVLFLVGCTDKATNNESSKSHNKEVEKQVEVNEGEQEVTEESPEEPESNGVETESEAEYYIAEDSSVVPLQEGTNENVVLLTIDDAPSTYSLQMAKTLKELDANAIFFVNGHFLDTPEEEEILKEIHAMGFFIGNHTYNHPLLPEISEDEQRNEIINLNERVEEIIGEKPKFFRAPNGMNTDFTEELVAKEEMVLMNWTYGYDYFKPYMDADKLAEAMVSGEGPEVDVTYSLLKPGANLLMHDREWTNEALESIVIGLREQGYEMVDPALIQVIEDTE